MTLNPKSIAVIGSGYWGKNLVRNMDTLGVLAMVSDSSSDILAQARKQYPKVAITSNFRGIFDNEHVKGVVIATPAATHYEIAKECLGLEKDVFVEKPLALKLFDAVELVELAKKRKRVLMVGHLLQYHPALLKLKALVDAGELGSIEYLYSNRLNLGKIRREENALWSFAPHDISIMLWLTNSLPIQVNSVGGSYIQPNIVDTTISTFTFDNGVRGHIYVSWLHPFKEQRLVVVGSKRMVVFDDLAPKEHKLLMYEKKVSKVNGNFVAEKPEGKTVPFDYDIEPLRSECEHFLQCMETREKPRTDGEEGLRVLKVLQSCQRSLQMNGQPVQVMDYGD